MAMLWEYPAQGQRAWAVPALVVSPRTRRAAAAPVGLSERYEWISANRQTLAPRTPAAPMTPRPVGPRLAAAVTVGATKAHDEALQRTQVQPQPGSHRRLLARCSLRISRHIVRRLQMLMSFSANERAWPSHFQHAPLHARGHWRAGRLGGFQKCCLTGASRHRGVVVTEGTAVGELRAGPERPEE
jgi:hypothetical protein